MPGYKAKTIKSIISGKITNWTATITDNILKERVRNNAIVTGGCIVSMLLGEDVNDFDVYLRDYDTAKQLAEYYVNKFESRNSKGSTVPLSVEADGKRVKIVAKSVGMAIDSDADKLYQYFDNGTEDESSESVNAVINQPEQIMDEHEETEKLALQTEGGKYRPVFLTSNAITLSDKVQIVIRFQGEPDDIHENYDFVHCTSYWTGWNNALVLNPAAMEAILAKELRYIGSRYPICSLVRLRKFINRGWRINAGQILKIAMQISELDLKDIDVLEDQLTGVDTAYFQQLIRSLKDKDPKTVDHAYLVEVVDRLF